MMVAKIKFCTNILRLLTIADGRFVYLDFNLQMDNTCSLYSLILIAVIRIASLILLEKGVKNNFQVLKNMVDKCKGIVISYSVKLNYAIRLQNQ